MSIQVLIGIIAGIVGPILTALVYLYKQREADRKEQDARRESDKKETLELTKSFIECQNNQTRALENNNRVIDRTNLVMEKIQDHLMLTAAKSKD